MKIATSTTLLQEFDGGKKFETMMTVKKFCLFIQYIKQMCSRCRLGNIGQIWTFGLHLLTYSQTHAHTVANYFVY